MKEEIGLSKTREKSKKSHHLERFYYTTDLAIEKPFNWKQIWRLLVYVKPYSKTYLPGAILMMLISTIVRLAVPILIGQVAIDIAIANKDTTMLTYLVLLIGILYLINYVGNIFRIKWVNVLGQNVIFDLR